MGTKRKIGLTLSGGGALGLAHIGVLKALEEEGIPIDMISGTSMGALIGAWYAKEGNSAILEEIACGIDWKEETHLFDVNLVLWKGFIQGKKVKSLLTHLIGDIEFSDLGMPFAAVATDARSMEEIVISEGSVIEAIRASISMPAIFTPARWHGRFLIDGGVVNPMPVDVIRKMGAAKVIASNVAIVVKKDVPRVTPPPPGKKALTSPGPHADHPYLLAIKQKINSFLEENKDRVEVLDDLSKIARNKVHAAIEKVDPQMPNMFEVLTQSLHAMQYEKIKRSAQLADIVINPDVSNIGTFDFYRADEAIARGYEATKEILSEIREKVYPSIPPST